MGGRRFSGTSAKSGLPPIRLSLQLRDAVNPTLLARSAPSRLYCNNVFPLLSPRSWETVVLHIATMVPSGLVPRSSLRCLTVLSAIGAVNAACYYPNGTDRNRGFPSDTYFPINPGDDFSMCCSHLGDKPRSDGLCANSDASVIWRESCTDRTWQSPKCIKLCAGTDPGKPDCPWLSSNCKHTESCDRYE